MFEDLEIISLMIVPVVILFEKQSKNKENS